MRWLIMALLAASPVVWAADAVAQDESEVQTDQQSEANPDAEAVNADSTDPASKEAPSTGAGADVPDAPPGADEHFAEELKRYRDSYGRYAREIQDYHDTIDALVEAEFNRRVAQINTRFDREIGTLELIERQRRNEAIARFQAFLERYPKSERYTPDALFRLAELYFEKANDDYMLADEEFQVQRTLYDSGRRADPPEEPERDFSQTMALFRRLINEWQNYRHLDGAYYLLAYCEQQMGNSGAARDLFAELITARPDSPFVPEAWLRIGEFHFDNPDVGGDSPTHGLQLARNAYEKVIELGETQFFDKALYKLAWTFYRMDDFDQAIAHFKDLVQYSDEMERKTGRSGAVLREEAVQYIAISLAEEDWDLDGVRDADFGLERTRRYLPGQESFEREVLLQLSDYLFDRHLYGETIGILEYALERFPDHRENPAIHEKIILALHRDQQRDRAFALRRELIDRYGPGSEWYAYHARLGNEEATRYADNIVKENLIQAATWYHEEAQKLRSEAQVTRDPELLSLAEQRYALAASAYEDFLTRYPNDKNVFEWNFYYADCLYFSRQYERAFEQYEVVRELDLEKNEYQERSAFNGIKALEITLRQMVERGELTATALAGLGLDDARETAQDQESRREEADPERDEQIVVVEAEPIPDDMRDYITAMDRYVVLQLKNPDDKYLDGKFAFQAAKIYYDFKHFDEARRRFAWVVENYSEHEVAYLAGSLILETYLEEKNYPMLAEWAERLGSVIKGEQAALIQEEVRQFRLGALFKSAETLYGEEKYEEAAEEYLRLVADAPEHPFAAKALNNAAVAYEVLKKYDAAMRLYRRIYQEYPDEPLAASALFRVAVNSEKFFEFDEAVRHYKLFYDQFRGRPLPELKDELGFDVEERRVDALKNAAVLLENLQRYEEAADGYIRFVKAYPNHDDADDALWQAVQVWEKAKKPKNMIDTIQTFIREYGENPDHNLRVLEGMMKIADHYEEQNDRRNATRWYNNILKEFEQRELEPASREAFYPAKAKFMLTEHQFEQWKALKIDGNLNRQKKLLQQKIEGQQKLTEEYVAVMNYRSLEWTMAANFRIGSLLQSFAYALYEVPIPFPEDSDEYYVYQEQLEDIAMPLEDKAIERFEMTIERARQDKIINEWTKKTLVELNKYKAAEYPLYKEERRSFQKRSLSGLSYLDAESFEEWKKREEPKEDEEDQP